MLPFKRLTKYIIYKPNFRYKEYNDVKISFSDSFINCIRTGIYLHLDYTSAITIIIYNKEFTYKLEFMKMYEYDDSGDLDDDKTRYIVSVSINDQYILEMEPSLENKDIYYMLYSHYDANWISYDKETINKKTLVNKIHYGKKFEDILSRCFARIELKYT